MSITGHGISRPKRTAEKRQNHGSKSGRRAIMRALEKTKKPRTKSTKANKGGFA